ncbi:hypothetical protein ACQKCH_12805 [Nubsella zeaxanthinifaciens]|uniref:hypothetical protein n=1 Tax=Nubsella zeaxanthinifaciens TaxID=392412 RepID=UPI003D06135B
MPAVSVAPIVPPVSTLIAVDNSSISAIIDALENLKSSAFVNSEWLTLNNRYIHDIINVYKEDVKKPRTYHKALADYTSTSSILHCSDAWTFISRAVSSLIEGDIPSAIFFTYYSELRSLMSLFATNGMSVLNNKHIYINNNGKAIKFGNRGTHDQVLLILEDYITHPTKTELLLEWLKVDNNTLKDWVRATGTLTSAYMTQDWLKKWSIDVKQIEFDHDTRNQVSYRPHKLKNGLYDFSYKDDLLKIVSFWELCEPTNSNSFYLLDRHLLRLSLEAIFDNQVYRGSSSNGRRNKSSKTYKSAFKRFIIKAAKNLSSKPGPNLVEFLCREESPKDSDIIIEANKPAYNKATKTYNVIPMIARSLMLLRISTGGSEYLVKHANIEKEDLKFWWSDYGNKYGFWEWGILPDDFKDDLWPDIADTLNNLKAYFLANPIQNSKNLNRLSIEDLNRFKQLNQIPLWGIGL